MIVRVRFQFWSCYLISRVLLESRMFTKCAAANHLLIIVNCEKQSLVSTPNGQSIFLLWSGCSLETLVAYFRCSLDDAPVPPHGAWTVHRIFFHKKMLPPPKKNRNKSRLSTFTMLYNLNTYFFITKNGGLEIIANIQSCWLAFVFNVSKALMSREVHELTLHASGSKPFEGWASFRLKLPYSICPFTNIISWPETLTYYVPILPLNKNVWRS